MLSWKQLQRWDLVSPDVVLYRAPTVEAAYAEHRKTLASKNVAIEDYVRLNVLNGAKYVLCKNKFPYNLEPGIEHLVFWMDADNEIPILEAKKIIESIIGKSVIIFGNRPAMRSVRNLPHYQVFVRRILTN